MCSVRREQEVEAAHDSTCALAHQARWAHDGAKHGSGGTRGAKAIGSLMLTPTIGS